jgi:L-asparaginase
MGVLGRRWTGRLPIVICSRCVTGNNYDDFHYRGSRAKYEGRGFLLAGYEHLTPLQARLLLVLRLSAAGAAGGAAGADAAAGAAGDGEAGGAGDGR